MGEPLPLASGSNPRLLRTGRLAQMLAARGHTVTWWTSAFDHFSKTHHRPQDAQVHWEGGVIRLLKSTGYRRNVSLMRFVEHAGVARKFDRMAQRAPRPDVILASLPTIELAHAAARLGCDWGVPVLVDVRDLWPDVLFDVAPPGLRWAARASLTWLTAQARDALSRCDGIVAVSDGYLDWALRYAGRPRAAFDDVIPLGYVAPATSRPGAEVQQSLVEKGVRLDQSICWYVGTFGRQYDLAPVIEAARSLQDEGRIDIQFVISGDGEAGPRWRAMAAGVRSVVFTGWIGADEINWLRRRASIGLQPYAAGAPQGLANKLFEYISAGIPVVSSLRGENEQLIAEHACGFTYEAGDARGCRRAILRLLSDEPMRRLMGANARSLFEARFDAAGVFDRLVTLVEKVASKRGEGRRTATRSAMLID